MSKYRLSSAQSMGNSTPVFPSLTFNGICLFVFLIENQLPPGFPTIDMGPQLKVVEKARTATMLCAASGNPDPEISWYKDFLPVDIAASNGRIKQLRSGKKFFISRTSAISELYYVSLSDSIIGFCSQERRTHITSRTHIAT